MTTIPYRRILLIVSTVAFVFAISQLAAAQREEGRRGRGGDGRGFGMGFGAPMVRLATLDEVEEALKLTDEQKDKVKKLNDEMRDQYREILDDGGRAEDLQEVSKSGTQKLIEILDEPQEKRITEITIQVYGGNAIFMHPTLGEFLKVTDEQRSQLGDVQRENMQAMGEAFGQMREQNRSRDEMRAKFEKLRAEADKKLLAVLTDEQRKQLDSLKGEKLEIDMSQLRGGRGGRGGRDGDRDRDRDRGGRDRDEADNDADKEDASTSS
jgi:Spy/CpxP family protein refolding chaperone